MNEVLLDITVIPKSSQSKIVLKDDTLKAYLHSPPENNKANKELILLVSKKLKISKTSIKITKGEKSRKKTLSLNFSSKRNLLKIFEN